MSKLRAFLSYPLYFAEHGVYLATSAGQARAHTVADLRRCGYLVPGQIDTLYSFAHIRVKRAPRYDRLADLYPRVHGYEPGHADRLLEIG
ncbi:hypothetical protein [Hymenobacter terricola]|uniref:hypothetical protein n=1 Tax=Hymenobacter terricola TaxID=2819236 RepID=UPI001B308CB4|nr:hypothetical protein [Hymenobacter terricola]